MVSVEWNSGSFFSIYHTKFTRETVERERVEGKVRKWRQDKDKVEIKW